MQAIVDFILELDKLKAVERKSGPIGLARHENSAEHSWHLAMMVTALAGYAAQTIDVDRVIRMVLVHDVGEIDIGDTIVYAETGWEERAAAELAAVKRIFGMLPGDLGDSFVAVWEEFEAQKTAEAKFARALDRAAPILLNLSNNGQSWRENGIVFEQVVRRNGPVVKAGCPALWDYIEGRLVEARDAGWFGLMPQRS
jgi:5'-deoxynucleotidase YfbR-like HD superfamily hydrolase